MAFTFSNPASASPATSTSSTGFSFSRPLCTQASFDGQQHQTTSILTGDAFSQRVPQQQPTTNLIGGSQLSGAQPHTHGNLFGSPSTVILILPGIGATSLDQIGNLLNRSTDMDITSNDSPIASSTYTPNSINRKPNLQKNKTKGKPFTWRNVAATQVFPFGKLKPDTMFTLATAGKGFFGGGQRGSTDNVSGDSQCLRESKPSNGTTIKFIPPDGEDTMLQSGQSTDINTRHQCVTAMEEYKNKSLEELRMEDYAVSRKGPSKKQEEDTSGLLRSTAANPSGFSFSSKTTPANSIGVFGKPTALTSSLFGKDLNVFDGAKSNSQNKSTGLSFGTGLFSSKQEGSFSNKASFTFTDSTASAPSKSTPVESAVQDISKQLTKLEILTKIEDQMSKMADQIFDIKTEVDNCVIKFDDSVASLREEVQKLQTEVHQLQGKIERRMSNKIDESHTEELCSAVEKCFSEARARRPTVDQSVQTGTSFETFPRGRSRSGSRSRSCSPVRVVPSKDI